MFSLFSSVFYLLNKSLKHHNQIMYTCIFISKKLQNNPILICIVRSLIGPQDLASPCKPWDRPMDLDVRSAHRLLHNILLYILGTIKPTYSWVYQTVQPSQYTIGFIKLQPIKPTFSSVYQTVNKLHALISTIHLYQQCTYINNQSLAKPT